jgi:AraC family transcriptional regulator
MQSAESLAPAAPRAVEAAPAIPVPEPACACAALAVAWRDIASGMHLRDERDAMLILVPFDATRFQVTVGGAGGEVRELTVSDPDVCVLAPGAAHGIASAGRALLAVLWLDRTLWEAHARTALGRAARAPACHVGRDAFVRHAAARLAGAARSDTPPGPEWLEAAAHELAAHLAARHARPLEDTGHPALAPDRLARVLALIDERLAEALQVRDLAAAVHLSPYHFARLFRQATGQAPHLYVTWQRMDRAMELLAQSDLPLVEVARRVGYHTQAHFTGVFHARVGTTPRAYRMRSRAAPGQGLDVR